FYKTKQNSGNPEYGGRKMKRLITKTKQEWMNERMSECGKSIIQSFNLAYRQAGHSIILLLILS
ncbi:MAG: hypothetical protein R6W68_06815, partial [Ignavibacteriaceae bacterium]